MTVRNYQDSDFPQLEKVLKATRLFDPNFDRRDRYRAKIESDPESIIVAEESGTVVGGAILIFDPFASSMWHLCVDPEYQGRGFGSKILEKAENFFQDRGVEIICGYVETGNETAISFYESKGWQVYRNMPIFPLEKKSKLF